MKVINFIVLVLVLAGAINWGLWGFFQFDFVAWLCNGNSNWLSRLIYAIIGLAGIWGLSFFGKCRAICGSGSCGKNPHDHDQHNQQ